MIDSTADPRTSIRQSSDGIRSSGGSRVIRLDELTFDERAAMYALFSRYFAADRAAFDRDLAEKQWIILLDDGSGAMAGFSTLMQFVLPPPQRPVSVFFSGDTVVDRPHWGSPQLARLWAQHVFGCAEASGARDVYWFLISSGFRTYRYLPLFFRRYSPSIEGCDRGEQSLLERIARMKFGDQYDDAAGIVRLRNRTPLRPNVSDPSGRAAVDRHVRFFLDANPGHGDGDELACLVRVSRDNLTAAGRRMLRGS